MFQVAFFWREIAKMIGEKIRPTRNSQSTTPTASKTISGPLCWVRLFSESQALGAAVCLSCYVDRLTNLTHTQEKKLEYASDACYRSKVTTNVKDLIDELKELNANGISQAKIARMLGVTRQRVNSWFKGDVTPTFDAGLKIQELLKGRK